MSRRLPILITTAVSVLLLSGCGDSTSVSGNVTYKGKPVESGAITFLPADGKGPSSGARIEGGRYQTEEMLPGPKIVQIIGIKEVDFTRPPEEKQRLLEAAAKRGDRSGLIDRADTIPVNAEGNNATVEVEAGEQTMDFELKHPPSS